MQKVHGKSRVFVLLFTIIGILIISGFMFKPALRLAFPLEYGFYIEKYSKLYDIDKYLVMSVISTESKFDPDATSHKDARGLMQIQDNTATWCMDRFGIEPEGNDLYDPELNINIGCSYMSYLLDKYSGNTDTALAAYNAGEGNVASWIEENRTVPGDIPFEETENYVKKVNNRFRIYNFIY